MGRKKEVHFPTRVFGLKYPLSTGGFVMNQMKKFSALAAGSMAIALLLGTSLAQAEALVCITDNTVTGIKGLDTVTKTYGPKTVDVDFTYTTGFDVYGSDLHMPWDEIHSEDDPFAVRRSINEALNANNSVPEFAGISGQNTYYIASEVETEPDAGGVGAIGAMGAANYAVEWEACKESGADNCIVGVAILQAADLFTYADLSLAATGATCDSGPPDELPPDSSFTITPGITGSWFDRTREGEGFNVEIIGEALDPQLLAYFYTYDDTGNQMWLTGVAAANGDTAVVPMTVTSGAVFGDDFKPADVDEEAWGTITFTFSSCDLGTAAYTSTNFGSGSFNIKRLTTVTGVNCP
jgi:hypothetical protein